VFYAISKDKSLEELTLDEFKQFSDIFENDVYNAISVETCVSCRNVIGGPAKEAMEKAIAGAKEILKKYE